MQRANQQRAREQQTLKYTRGGGAGGEMLGARGVLTRLRWNKCWGEGTEHWEHRWGGNDNGPFSWEMSRGGSDAPYSSETSFGDKVLLASPQSKFRARMRLCLLVTKRIQLLNIKVYLWKTSFDNLLEGLTLTVAVAPDVVPPSWGDLLDGSQNLMSLFVAVCSRTVFPVLALQHELMVSFDSLASMWL